MRDRVIGKVGLLVDTRVVAAVAEGVTATLSLDTESGQFLKIETDHVISATGYHVSADRLDLRHPQLRQELRLEAGSPVLSSGFESSVPGLYFIDVTAANTFGPVMRFARGYGAAAGGWSRYCRRRARPSSVRIVACRVSTPC